VSQTVEVRIKTCRHEALANQRHSKMQDNRGGNKQVARAPKGAGNKQVVGAPNTGLLARHESSGSAPGSSRRWQHRRRWQEVAASQDTTQATASTACRNNKTACREPRGPCSSTRDMHRQQGNVAHAAQEPKPATPPTARVGLGEVAFSSASRVELRAQDSH